MRYNKPGELFLECEGNAEGFTTACNYRKNASVAVHAACCMTGKDKIGFFREHGLFQARA